jgi:Ca2+-binding EF-hand superfamily protein
MLLLPNQSDSSPCTGLFIEADSDGSGYLDKKEFSNVLNSAQLSLSDR